MSTDELCRGDRIDGAADLFRILRRGREYLVEADRHLRDGGSPDEQADRVAWYADMDANDEWTGTTADAHVACALDVVLYFDEHPEIVRQFDRKPFMIDYEWRRLEITRDVEALRRDAEQLLMRIGAADSLPV